MENLTLADLYAAKSQAKEKEAYFRMLKAVSADAAVKQAYWMDILDKANLELEKRIKEL